MNEIKINIPEYDDNNSSCCIFVYWLFLMNVL